MQPLVKVTTRSGRQTWLKLGLAYSCVCAMLGYTSCLLAPSSCLVDKHESGIDLLQLFITYYRLIR